MIIIMKTSFVRNMEYFNNYAQQNNLEFEDKGLYYKEF